MKGLRMAVLTDILGAWMHSLATHIEPPPHSIARLRLSYFGIVEPSGRLRH
jgi:hypothetical protein